MGHVCLHKKDQEYFWEKRTILYYFLAVFVFLRHISCFSNYSFNESGLSLIVQNITSISNAFTLIAVPLFFMMSGMLFFRNYEQRVFVKKLYKRKKSLLYPYLILNVI